MTLHNMAHVYDTTGQSERALALYKQVLPIAREVGDRAGEAMTLNNMGAVYYGTGQLQRALALYEQALPITRAVGDRRGEARVLSNMGNAMKQPQRALTLHEQALDIRREVGDHAGEAATLKNMSYIYIQRSEPERAVETLRYVVQINREIDAVAAEAAALDNLANVLHYTLGQTAEAIRLMTRSVEILTRHNLPQDSGGGTVVQHREFLAELRSAMAAPAMIPAHQLEIIVNHTIAVLTAMPEKRDEWRTALTKTLVQRQQQGSGWSSAAEFLRAVVALLDGSQASLPAGHPYAAALAAILAGVGSPDQAGTLPADTCPLSANFVVRCVAGLRGAPADKVALFNSLEASAAAHPGFQVLLQTVQAAIFGADLATLGADLAGEEAALWRQIVAVGDGDGSVSRQC